MLPLRLVIDTNVLVSAAIKPAGLQRTVLLLAITKPARFYVSRPILEEHSEVLSRPELRIRKGLRRQLLQLIKNHSYPVAPTRRLEFASDPDDNIFPGVRRRGPCGLSGDWQSEAFSAILEENKSNNTPRIH
jgi:putative PIN family toxin of toxin-antitoxin system